MRKFILFYVNTASCIGCITIRKAAHSMSSHPNIPQSCSRFALISPSKLGVAQNFCTEVWTLRCGGGDLVETRCGGGGGDLKNGDSTPPNIPSNLTLLTGRNGLTRQTLSMVKDIYHIFVQLCPSVPLKGSADLPGPARWACPNCMPRFGHAGKGL